MRTSARQAGLIALVCAILAVPASAGIYFTEFGGAKQIWMTADSFTLRSYDSTIGGFNFVEDTAATGTLPGGVYYFPGPTEEQDLLLEPTTYDAFSHPFENNDWFVQYEIPIALIPAGWGNLEDTSWAFFARTMTTISSSMDSNFLIVNGHPTDVDKANPTSSEWLYAASINNPGYGVSGSATSLDDRIQNGLAPHGHLGYGNWAWHSDSGTADETLERVVSKQFGIYDGKITFRIYEREAYEGNGRNNGMCWVFDPTGAYVPSDADARRAGIPEPSSFLTLCMGGVPALCLLTRRKRS